MLLFIFPIYMQKKGLAKKSVRKADCCRLPLAERLAVGQARAGSRPRGQAGRTAADDGPLKNGDGPLKDGGDEFEDLVMGEG